MTLIETAYGPARVVVAVPAGEPLSLLVLGHGAGGDVDAPDLAAVAGAALDAGAVVARVTQPYRVAGRRAPAPAAQLDSAWTAAVAQLRGAGQPGAGRPLIVGGRSSGARVACRTAGPLGAAGVVALAFPLHPPGRPDRSRAGELTTGVPTLVVNGAADPFGVPVADGQVEVCVRPGERHDLRRDPAAVGAVVVGWLRRHGWAS
ncbi:MAG TPA: alpha/beta family hydrolase [Micromonosporaceae bacterium]|nr:alpha/beta family hydrolase [Micromonosporaceae bacterium]